MKIMLAYCGLVLIWSTTPLAIKWSTDDLSFVGAIFWRVAIATVLAVAILLLRRQSLWGYPKALPCYLLAAVGIAPNFLLVCWAAERISSGLIAIIFSTTPFIIGLFSYCFLNRQVFTAQRLGALCLAMLGLLMIFADQLVVSDTDALWGMLAMVLSTLVFSSSAVGLQALAAPVPNFQKTVGGLCFSLPLLLFVWLWVDGSLPWGISTRTVSAVVYLSIFGSLLGFTLYFYLISHLSAYVTSTVGMLSPVFSLIIADVIAGEILSLWVVLGAACVLLAQLLYHVPLRKWCRIERWLKAFNMSYKRP